MENNDKNTPMSQSCKNAVIDSFNAWDFAVEYASETLNYMNEDELDAIHYYDNKSELIKYLDMFYERT